MTVHLPGSGFRTAVAVTLVLLASATLTGLFSSAYRSKKRNLGEEHFHRAEQLAHDGNAQEAVVEYRRALLFEPDDSHIRLSLATSLITLHRLEEAQAHLQQLLVEDPTNGLINLLLGRIAEQRKNPTSAIAFYHRAVYGYWPSQSDENRRNARWELVSVLQKANRRNEVTGELMQLYADAPEDPAYRSKIGFLLLQYGATSNALEVFRDLTRTNPKYVEAYHGLGQALFDSGEYVEARHEFQRAIHLDPKDRENFSLLAETNAVIDLDPGLPRITAAERVRRSGNLLRRVLDHVTQCSPQTPSLQVTEAQKLLTTRHSTNADFNLQLQDTAQQIWHDRASLCGGNVPNDRVLEVVLTRLSHE